MTPSDEINLLKERVAKLEGDGLLGRATCSGDNSDSAPYWLCYGMAQYLTEIAEPCERAATGGELCANTDDCITEWCAPCAAKAWLQQEQVRSRPLPLNARLTDGGCVK